MGCGSSKVAPNGSPAGAGAPYALPSDANKAANSATDTTKPNDSKDPYSLSIAHLPPVSDPKPLLWVVLSSLKFYFFSILIILRNLAILGHFYIME